MTRARADGNFTEAHQAYWDATRARWGDAAGTRALIEVRLAHRTLPRPALLAAIEVAVAAGILDPQAVIIEARRAATPPPPDRSRSVPWPATTGPLPP